MEKLINEIEVLTLNELEILKDKNTFIFDWDDTIVEYNPTVLSLRAAQAVLMVLSDIYNLNLDTEGLRVLDLKTITNLIRNTSENLYGNKHAILKCTYNFAIERDSAKLRADAIKELPDLKDKMRDFWIKFELVPDDNLPDNLKPLRLTIGLENFITLATKNDNKCFVVSNSPRTMLQKSIDYINAKYGFDTESIFQDIICLRDLGVEYMKPNPRSMFNLMEKHGLEAEKSIYIGNAAEDVEYAKKSGISSIRIGQKDTNLFDHEHIIIRNFNELLSN